MKITLMNSMKRAGALTVLLAGFGIAHAGTWEPLANQANFLNPGGEAQPPDFYSYGGVFAPILMTDGSVLVRTFRGFDDFTFTLSEIYLLKPDIHGSYVNGNWTRIADLPSGYQPIYTASAILPDGRLIIEGAEESTQK